MSEKPLVAVAMSGGVDSSAAAALLVEQGYPVVGLMLRLWSQPGCEDLNRCCTPDAMNQAAKVAGQLGIPFYVLDAKEAFRQTVVQSFLEDYSEGRTPNPCIRCNRFVRWGFLLEKAQGFGAEFLATGHYARLVQQDDGRVSLRRAADANKDQTYVLSVLTKQQLAQTLFPLGEMTKPEVRELARRFNLPTAERPESQDLCFLAGEDYRSFLERMIPDHIRPGEIVDTNGEVVGRHTGLTAYTIGQRKGLGIAAPAPLYVIAIDRKKNQLVVGRKEELGSSRLTAGEMNWIRGEAPAEPMECGVKIRYKANEAAAVVTPLEGGRVQIDFDQPLRDITPGQRAVLYSGEECLGGGTIEG